MHRCNATKISNGASVRETKKSVSSPHFASRLTLKHHPCNAVCPGRGSPHLKRALLAGAPGCDENQGKKAMLKKGERGTDRVVRGLRARRC